MKITVTSNIPFQSVSLSATKTNEAIHIHGFLASWIPTLAFERKSLDIFYGIAWRWVDSKNILS